MARKPSDNADGFIGGMEIFKRHEELGVKRVGRQGGLKGLKFTNEVRSGAWKEELYDVGYDKLSPDHSVNWFSIQDFLNAVKAYK